MQQAFVKLTDRVNALESVDAELANARKQVKESHDSLNQAFGAHTVYKNQIAELTEQLQLAQSSSVTHTSHTRLLPKHPDPEKFSGDRDKLEAWIIQVNTNMTRNADHFVFAGQDTLQNKMFYVISRLEDDAVGHVQPYVTEDLSRVNLEGWKKIIKVLKLAYADADPKGTARRAVISLYQTNKRFEHFWAEFHRLAQKAGMDSATTLEYLKDRLSSEIKD